MNYLSDILSFCLGNMFVFPVDPASILYLIG